MRLFYLSFALLSITVTKAQEGNWKARLHREDGNNIVFNFDWKTENGRPVWYIKNADEKLRVDNITTVADSFLVQMPVFESQFRFVVHDKTITGTWIKRGAFKTQVMSFSAVPNEARFVAHADAGQNVSGRWAVKFGNAESKELSVAEFVQKGNLLTGTFLNADGDYRYLEGIVTNDTIFLSGFDGGHSFLFKARIENNSTITDGMFYSGATGKQPWSAVKDDKAALDYTSVAMYVKPGEDSSINFSFKDLEGRRVALNSDRFKNKVIVVQIMGSWCPNCMDETAFLSDYYDKNKQRGVEVIALAYEYSTNWQRSVNSLKKFQQRFNVKYAILNTEVPVTDSLRTEKTLPQVTAIKSFPSSIIVDKKGKIRKLDTEFSGPATGAHYTAYKREFEDTIDQLLKEKTLI